MSIYTLQKHFMVTTKTIAISVENYDRLKKYGCVGESLNQAIGKLLAVAAGEKSG
jgi:predicted CopG family antitoxin